MLNGRILDVYPDHKKNMMVIWLVDNDRKKRITDRYTPSFYVYSKHDELLNLVSILRENPQVKLLNLTYEKIILGSEKKKLVLQVKPKKLKDLKNLSEKIDSWGGYHRYKLFNVDIRLSTRYLQNKGVFFNSNVKWDNKKFILDDEQWAIDYNPPNYKKTTFEIQRKSKSKIMSFKDPIKSITIGDTLICEGNETDTILLAVKQLQHIDPDIIYTNKGDSVLLPFLYHRAKINDIQHRVVLGREKNKTLHPVKQAKSYFTYGQIVYRPAFYILHGRAHIDRYNSFMYGESGLRGLLDISRCSNISLQMLSRVGPGTAISQIQVNKAREKGFLIPWKKTTPESWKTMMDLLVSDRGGLILDPVVGIHDDVVELDFASLYPNIMLRFNVSPETMLCDCCKNSPGIVVPQLGYHICDQQMGLLPEVLKPVLHRRFCYKARAKNKKYDTGLYKELQQAWKWVLLVCFGYTGYRNARYGRIECYESITAFSRDILLTAMETVEKHGYRVLHGIIDSLWVQPMEKCVTPVRLSRIISEQTGVRMDLEGQYKWIVFLPCKGMNVGALNRYYGMFNNGEIKVRGVELRQRNSPVFLKNMQRDMLNVFSKADNSKEFKSLIPCSLEVIKEYGRRIINKNVNLEELVIKNCVSRDISEYKVNSLVKSALLQLRDLGVQLEPGQSVRYVVCNENTRNYRHRVCIVEKLDSIDMVDVDFYLRQVAMYGESLLAPFGYTAEKLFEMLQKIKHREDLYVSALS